MNYLDKEEYNVNIKSSILDYGILNQNLINQSELRFTMRQPLELPQLKINYNDLMSNHVSAEFSQSLEKELKKMMSQCEDYLDLVDLTNLQQDTKEKQTINRLINFLVNSKYDFILINGTWASHLQYNYLFSLAKENSQGISAQCYFIGKIGNVDVYVDPYMRYNEDWIICGMKDSFQYNMKFDSIKEYDYEADIVGHMNFSLKYNITITNQNFIKLHLMYAKTEVYSKFIIDRRDKKLDTLLK